MQTTKLFFICIVCGLSGCSPKGPQISIDAVWSLPVLIHGADTSSGNSHAGHGFSASANGVVYMTVKNGGSMADRLLSVESNICQNVEIHETKTSNDRMAMQKVDGVVTIPPGSEVRFQPRGLHIMLIGLKESLKAGNQFSLELQFEQAGKVTISSTVRAL